MLVVMIILFLIAGGLGGIFVQSSIASWYSMVKRPFFSPPDMLFGPVWTALYILLAVFYWRLDKLESQKPAKTKQIKSLKNIFILQIILNFMWTPVFFGLRSIFGGLIVILLLDFFVIIMTKMSYKTDKKCFFISLIYLLWLLYATSLNIGLLLLN